MQNIGTQYHSVDFIELNYKTLSINSETGTETIKPVSTDK